MKVTYRISCQDGLKIHAYDVRKMPPNHYEISYAIYRVCVDTGEEDVSMVENVVTSMKDFIHKYMISGVVSRDQII